ncbi:UPF0187-domain-containing protein [Artomyces pyxidatus]|uniref:UPF0187-domain-containing protein n=1 Tax=Artomyces pyxidatus TaxID=48021 RepID=A0ACB8TF44_9AGAM|nr:UPF0187-domain-containing protein [Artomyces pyxidatus]
MDSAGQETHFVGNSVPDPFASPRGSWPTFFNAVLATAVFRCWHILIFFAAWSTTICVISATTFNLGISNALLTVLGTVLGFVISYRTTSSFERYNEGRRYWSQIILGSRTLARMIWFHVPDVMDLGAPNMSVDEKKARILVEKKTVLNLIEAFSVAVKHYLRGEEGIYYVDLYHLVKYLPSYALPAGLPSAVDVATELPTSPKSLHAFPTSPSLQRRVSDSRSSIANGRPHIRLSDAGHGQRSPGLPRISTPKSPSASAPHLPLPVTSSEKSMVSEKITFVDAPPSARLNPSSKSMTGKSARDSIDGDGFLLPARNPPEYSYFDIFPFSLLVRFLTKRGKEVKGKKGAKLRAKLRNASVTHNLPLEISLYMSSYIAALQARKAVDPPTATNLIGALNQLVDALTGLERILTTPIPFSYSVHLWSVTLVYCFVLPFQLWNYLKWLTIPGTVIASFIFFGFLVAGEEIENPFGYDKNDLNLDHFTNNIIRNELRAITATPTPNPADWAFSVHNDLVFNTHTRDAERVVPEEWVQRGRSSMQAVLAGSI